jgi:hypothetical protein
MDMQADRICDLVIEAGALVDWLETGRGDVEIVGAALLYLRDSLGDLADQTADAEARDTACEMVAAIERALVQSPARRREHRAA